MALDGTLLEGKKGALVDAQNWQRNTTKLCLGRTGREREVSASPSEQKPVQRDVTS